MKKVFLAIQTPRAGKWNHRWLVPYEKDEDVNKTNWGVLLSKLKSELPNDVQTNQPSVESPQDSTTKNVVENVTDGMNIDANASDNTEEALSDVVNNEHIDNRVRSSVVEDGILFFKNTVQGLASSGRTGVEELFLYAKGFGKTVPENIRKECFEKLGAFFNEKLEGIIKSIDWGSASPAMVHTSADLKNLAGGPISALAEFDNLYSEISDLLNPYIIEQEPEPSENEPEQSDKTKSGSPGSAPQPSASTAKKTSFFNCFLGLCVIIAFLIPIAVMAKPGTMDKVKQGIDKFANWLQETINQQQSSSMSDEDFEKWSQLFEFPNDVKPEEREDVVKKAIEQTYRYYWGKKPNSGDCSLSGTLASDINNLNQDNPKVLSQEKDKSKFECLRNVNPVEFRMLVNDYLQAQSMLETMINDYSIPAAQKSELKKKIDISSFKWNSDIYPRFFFNRNKDDNDVVIAKNLKSIFEDSVIDKAIQRFNDPNAVYMDGANEKKCMELYNQWEPFKFEDRVKNMFPDLNP